MLRLLIFCLMTLSLRSTARGTPTDTYGALPDGLAAAGARTAAAEGGEAAYYNPAGLGVGAAGGKASVQIGYALGMPSFFIDREKQDAASLEAHPNHLPERQGWLTVGAALPLGGIFKERVGLGMLLYLPQGKVARVQSLDPRTPQFLRYQSSLDRIHLDLGLGVRINDYVSVGVGLDVFAGLDGAVDFDIDLFSRRVNSRALTFDFVTSYSPTAGVVVSPLEGLRLGFSFRGANELNVHQPNTIAMGEMGALGLIIDGVVHYTPQSFAFGASYEPLEGLSLSADLKYQRWSQAPYPAMKLDVVFGGELAEGLGLDELFTFGSSDPETGFQDTLTPGIAAQYTTLSDALTLKAGYSWRPTYVPDQVNRSNFLDNDAHLFGLGAAWCFSDPTGVFTEPLCVDLATQTQVLSTREVKKRQAADAVGDLSHGGVAFTAHAALRYEF